MNFKGWQGTTVLDFPDRVASILFTGGCNLRCPYCHNICIVVDPDSCEDLPADEVLARIAGRAGFIDGIVVTGGEPTIQPGLADFLREFRRRFPDLDVKLDTNGLRPDVLKTLLDESLLAMVAIDVKTDPRLYPDRLGADPTLLRASLDLLRNAEIRREIRTTTWREWMDGQTPEAIAELAGSDFPVFLQRCSENGLSLAETLKLQERMRESGCRVQLRGYGSTPGVFGLEARRP